MLAPKDPYVILNVLGSDYRVARLSAWDAWALLNATQGVTGAIVGSADAFSVASALGKISDAEADRILARIFVGVERRRGLGWAPAWAPDEEPAEDDSPMDMHAAVQVAAAVLVDRLAPFFLHRRANIPSKTPAGPSWEAAELPDNTAWLMEPVLRGLCKFESLIDGTLDLGHLAIMNDAIRWEAENKARAQAAAAAAAK